MSEIFIERAGEWHGPFGRTALRFLLDRGDVSWETPCRIEGSEEICRLEIVLGRPDHAGAGAGRWFGLLLICAGVVGLIYLLGFFDVSLPVQKLNPRDFGLDSLPFAQPDRVVNIGLMQTRLIWVIVSSLAVLSGLILAVFGRQPRS